jgi:outer membrane protein
MKMRKRLAGGIFIALGFLMIFDAAAWAASNKMGYFDLQAVLEQSRYGKQARDDFKKEKDTIKAEMDEKARAFKTAKEEFDKKKSVMDESAKNKKTKEIQEMQQQGEKYLMEAQAKLNKLSSDLMAPIVDKVIDIVKKIGKEDKYDYIMEVGKGGIVYANDKDDLTKKVVDELDRSTLSKP